MWFFCIGIRSANQIELHSSLHVWLMKLLGDVDKREGLKKCYFQRSRYYLFQRGKLLKTSIRLKCGFEQHHAIDVFSIICCT